MHGGQDGAGLVEPAPKRPKLEEPANQLHSLRNIIEINGKSCTHEVAWPSGAPRLINLAEAAAAELNSA